ncbi:hypothetical protein Nos7524_3983 [Nostoc sp. PCC 7524]|jgi:hypothetical protein|uniref:hypothetical protein n=1 Tax=Nostoc sp. (strain ATCC 29411 / PCC 7524) TaxID=28072 RepID=UPI00029F4D67|nr:hypothetical protein [Nostoc sp. PCC 7524]AFY49756.1 hypothetical protein Nos7524_3983 [Nostoc sp. PCC 7524]
MSNIKIKVQIFNNIPGIEDLTNQNAAAVSGGSSGFMGGRQSHNYHYRRRSDQQHFSALSAALHRRGLRLPSSLTLLSRFPHFFPR